MAKYILSLDQGTTTTRAIIFDTSGNIVSKTLQEFSQIFPQAGWVEHNPLEIWETQLSVIKKAFNQLSITGKDIAAIGITNQRETIVVWDRLTGKPIYNAIVWQDKRTSQHCDALKAQGLETLITEKTGLLLDAYFSATKLAWVLDHIAGAREKAASGGLLFGTIDSWLVWNLTGGKQHITDVSNASRTLLFNINSLQWDKELLSIFKIPAAILPKVKASSEVYGHTKSSLFNCEIPIAGIAGDQQAALFGQMCTKPGMVKNTYGTGCFMLMNIGHKPIISKNKLLTTVAWQINNKTTYALEGSIFVAGAVVQWLRDSLKIIKETSEVEALAASVPTTEGVFFVPAFVGLGAPFWNQDARGTLLGLTRGSTNAHIARAALESIAFQTMEVLHAMETDTGISIKELRVDGGATLNNMLMQFQAEVLNTTTVRPKITETTAMGAAFLAGLAVGYWKNIDEIQRLWQEDTCYKPSNDRQAIKNHILGWNKAVKAVAFYAKN